MADIDYNQTNPFPGLRPFEAENHHLFFGREVQVKELLQRLERSRFLAVTGPSGSGKSSLIRAGLIPQLSGTGSAASVWRQAAFRPGDDPFRHFAEALLRDGAVRGGVDDVIRALEQDGLKGVLCQMDDRLSTRLLVLVDQFEELTRFDPSGAKFSNEKVQKFVELLLLN